MSLLNKVKALFAEEPQIQLADTVFVKTVDGQIFLVKAPELALDVEVVAVDEAGTEQEILDGDYTLEDGTVISVLGGKIGEISTKEEEATDTNEEDVVPAEMEAIPAGDYTLDNGDVITIDENQVVINWVKAELPVEAEEVMETVTEDFSAINIELQAKINELELAIEAKDKEVKFAKEAFDKLKSEPATKPIDKKKFEKTERISNQLTMLEKVNAIVNKNK